MGVTIPDPTRPGREAMLLDADTALVGVHPEGSCLLQHCVIHNPSQHPLSSAPFVWLQTDEFTMMFRRCEHDAIHPDPDDLAFQQVRAMLLGLPWAVYDGWHPCCPQQCCINKTKDTNDRAGQGLRTDHRQPDQP